ncbi:MAG: hypothetical protein IPF54_20080 [Draconibacterium sp.]|nr:hypothetical protein [Draconibacterium sp.]
MVIQDFSNAHAVWFKRSGSFLLFGRTRFFVLQQILGGKKKTAVIKKVCRKKYDSSESDIDTFVDEIIQYTRTLNSKQSGDQVSKKKEAKLEPVPENFSFISYYKFGKTIIRIDYQDGWLLHLVHPRFSSRNRRTVCFKTSHPLLSFREFIVVSCNHKITEAFNFDMVEYYSGAISQLIYSIIYKKSFTGWMCTLHASGVYYNNNAIIFSAAAGSGKSTVSAILKANGLDYISDDFVAATPDGHVYPFPASMSVKDGAFSVLSKYYPELGGKVPEKASTGKMVRYLPVNNFSENMLNGIRVSGFISVSYQAGSGFSITDVSKKEALQFLLKETWVNPKPAFVKAFFEWVEKTPFYRMTYSDNEKMVSGIKSLLSYEG